MDRASMVNRGASIICRQIYRADIIHLDDKMVASYKKARKKYVLTK